MSKCVGVPKCGSCVIFAAQDMFFVYMWPNFFSLCNCFPSEKRSALELHSGVANKTKNSIEKRALLIYRMSVENRQRAHS